MSGALIQSQNVSPRWRVSLGYHGSLSKNVVLFDKLNDDAMVTGADVILRVRLHDIGEATVTGLCSEGRLVKYT